jgi:hypothetical protein
LAFFAEGVTYRWFEADFVGANGRTERLTCPPHQVSLGRSPEVLRGFYELPAIAAHQAATRGSGVVGELHDLDDDEVYILWAPLEVRVGDIFVEEQEWLTFVERWGASIPRTESSTRPSVPPLATGNEAQDLPMIMTRSDALAFLGGRKTPGSWAVALVDRIQIPTGGRSMKVLRDDLFAALRKLRDGEGDGNRGTRNEEPGAAAAT